MLFFQTNISLSSIFSSINSLFIHTSSSHHYFIHTFCFSQFCFIERYGVRCRFDKKLSGTLNWLFLIFVIKNPFTDDSNIYLVSFLRSYLSEINLHNFILVMLCSPRYTKSDTSLIQNLQISSIGYILSSLTTILVARFIHCTLQQFISFIWFQHLSA